MRAVLVSMHRSRSDHLAELLRKQAWGYRKVDPSLEKLPPTSQGLAKLIEARGPALLECAQGENGGPNLAECLKSAKRWANYEEDVVALVGQVTAAELIASTLAQGGDLRAAIDQWIAEASSIISFVLDDPGLFIVLNVEHAINYPDNFNTIFFLRKAKELMLQPEPLRHSTSLNQLYFPLAEKILEDDVNLRHLDSQLKAIATLPARSKVVFSLDAIQASIEANVPHASSSVERTAQSRLCEKHERGGFDEKRAEVSAAEAQQSGFVHDLESELKAVKAWQATTQTRLSEEIERLRSRLVRVQSEYTDVTESLWWQLGGPLRRVWRSVSEVIHANQKAAQDAELVRKHELFDGDWYLHMYKDVVGVGVDPAYHFVKTGWKDGRSPGPGFDLEAYLNNNPDIKKAKVNPFIHYITVGRFEQRAVFRVEGGYEE